MEILTICIVGFCAITNLAVLASFWLVCKKRHNNSPVNAESGNEAGQITQDGDEKEEKKPASVENVGHAAETERKPKTGKNVLRFPEPSEEKYIKLRDDFASLKKDYDKLQQSYKDEKQKEESFSRQLSDKKRECVKMQKDYEKLKKSKPQDIQILLAQVEQQNEQIKLQEERIKNYSNAEKETKRQINEIRQDLNSSDKDLQNALSKVAEMENKEKVYASLIRDISKDDENAWFNLKRKIDIYGDAAGKFGDVSKICSDIFNDSYAQSDADSLLRAIGDIMKISAEVSKNIRIIEGDDNE